MFRPRSRLERMASTSPNQEPEGKQAKAVPRATPLVGSAQGRPLPQAKPIPRNQAATPPQIVVPLAANEQAEEPDADPLTAKVLDYSPPWLFSLAFHMFVLIVMGLTLKFPMSESAMAEVRRVLDDRRLELAEAGKPTDEVAEEFVHEHPDLLKKPH